MSKRYELIAMTWVLWLVAALAPVSAAQGLTDDEPRFDELPNFHRVSARLFRGGQPRSGGIHKLAALGVNTIINLRDDDEREIIEARESQAAGLRYFNVPFKRLGRPTDAQIERALSLMAAPENGVVFVHCEHGSDRTGTVIAVYRIAHDGWTREQAKREAKRYGMKFWQRGMKSYIDDYSRGHARPTMQLLPTSSVISARRRHDGALSQPRDVARA